MDPEIREALAEVTHGSMSSVDERFNKMDD
jgi:hypothetical protein